MQRLPQPPQLAGSAPRLAHVPEQFTNGVAQVEAHVPPEQTDPLGQLTPQVRQFKLSEFRFASQPFAAFPSQLPKPESQMKPHEREMHVDLA